VTDEELSAEYHQRHANVLVPLAERLQPMLADAVAGLPRIDRVAVRAKSPDRFLAKAAKQDRGVRKYDRPLEQIQDQVGARVIAFYLDDVMAVSSTIDKYFRHIEARDLVPESESEFGYVGKHYILLMPEDVYPDDEEDVKRMPKFFELQVKTLFQHAWSEAGHDLAYKPVSPLTSLQKRQLAFTAAQAWGADQMFCTLYNELFGTHGIASE
jgi:putative GTP pyrophosphokinase